MNNIKGAERRFTVSINVPESRLQAFNAMLDDFWSGESKWEVLHVLREHRRSPGVESLKRLFEFAESNFCGGSQVIALVLASLYNGYRFRVDLTDLRLLSGDYFQDVLNVLFLDHAPEQEVHQYFASGGRRFEALFERYGLPDRGKPTTHFEGLKNIYEDALKEGLDAHPTVAARLRHVLQEKNLG